MSRIGNMPITVPAGVEVKIDGNHIAVKGPEGNIEYLLYLQNTNKEQGEKLSDIIPEEVVEKSHQELDK